MQRKVKMCFLIKYGVVMSIFESEIANGFGELKQDQKSETKPKQGAEIGSEQMKRDVRHWESQMSGRPSHNRHNSIGGGYTGPCRIIF